MSEDIENCEYCAEDAMHVEVSKNEHIVRVRRKTKCNLVGNPCRTITCQSKKEAIDLWNLKQERRRAE